LQKTQSTLPRKGIEDCDFFDATDNGEDEGSDHADPCGTLKIESSESTAEEFSQNCSPNNEEPTTTNGEDITTINKYFTSDNKTDSTEESINSAE